VLSATLAVLIGFAALQGIIQAEVFYRPEAQTNQQGSVIWGANESNPSSPIRIKLRISSAPPLGKTAELLAVVTSAMDASDVEVQIRLPQGFAVISGGSPDWKGNVPRDHPVELRYVVMSVQVGDWVIDGHVKWSFAEGSFYTDSDRIYISVSESSAYISTTTFSETTSLPPGNETQPPTSVQTGDSQLMVTSGALVMFVSPTLVAVGIETTVVVYYGVSSTPDPTATPPSVMIHGGTPSFEGPMVVTYGPALAGNGMEWVAKIKPTSTGSIKVIGQDQSGTVHAYAEIKVVDNLPPPVGQPAVENGANQYIYIFTRKTA